METEMNCMSPQFMPVIMTFHPRVFQLMQPMVDFNKRGQYLTSCYAGNAGFVLQRYVEDRWHIGRPNFLNQDFVNPKLD